MQCTFALVGEVDHGKSTLGGQLLYLSNYISEHDFEMLRREATLDKMESWTFSRILDTLKDEQLRGKTHEFTSVEFNNSERKFRLIDTPGHKLFVPSMISGITFVEGNVVGCLVVSSLRGEFESGFERGQTKEVVVLMRAVGITHLIVAINKMDAIPKGTDEKERWSQSRYDQIIKDMTPFIKQCGFKEVNYIPVSALHGTNLVDNKDVPEWVTLLEIPSLLDALHAMSTSFSENTNSKSVQPLVCKVTHLECDIKILHIETLITSGYVCILHIGQQEVEAKIVKIKDVQFIRTPSTVKIVFELFKHLDIYNKARIIMRSSNKTIGFGRINRVKTSNKMRAT